MHHRQLIGLGLVSLLAACSEPAADVTGLQPGGRPRRDVQLNPPSWGLDRIDWGGMDDKYTYPHNGAGVTVYVLDTGIDVAHPQFNGRARAGYDAFAAMNDGGAIGEDGGEWPVGQSGTDCGGHGTAVAGVIGANTYGVAKGARLVSVKVIQCTTQGLNPTPFSIAQGLRFVLHEVTMLGVRPAVVSISTSVNDDPEIDGLVAELAANRVLVAASTGNGSFDACTQSPAGADQALAVSGITQSGGNLFGTGTGACVDVYAPAGSIATLVPGGGTRTDFGGTSSAVPHAAGVAAQHLGISPNLSHAALKACVEYHAELVGTRRVVRVPATGPWVCASRPLY